MIGCTIIPLALLSLYALQGGLYALWEAVVLFNFNSHIQLQDSPVQLDTISAHSHIASIPVFTFPLYAIISYYIPLILFPLLGIVAGGLIFAQKRKNALCIVGLLLTGQLIIWAQPSESLYHPAPLCLLSMAILFYPPQTRRMAQLITSLFVLWVLSAAPYIVIEATRLIRSYDYTQMSAHDAAQG